jgi:hypothetical protein
LPVLPCSALAHASSRHARRSSYSSRPQDLAAAVRACARGGIVVPLRDRLEVCMRICMRVCVCVCMRVCMCGCLHVTLRCMRGVRVVVCVHGLEWHVSLVCASALLEGPPGAAQDGHCHPHSEGETQKRPRADTSSRRSTPPAAAAAATASQLSYPLARVAFCCSIANATAKGSVCSLPTPLPPVPRVCRSRCRRSLRATTPTPTATGVRRSSGTCSK